MGNKAYKIVSSLFKRLQYKNVLHLHYFCLITVFCYFYNFADKRVCQGFTNSCALKFIFVFFLSINLLRLCRIVLDNFPNVLRIILKNEIQRKYGFSWKDDPSSGNFLVSNDRWQARLGKEQLNQLQNGNTAEWDSTLLFYVLLHSSFCLCADKLQGTQCIITVESNVVSASVPSFDF